MEKNKKSRALLFSVCGDPLSVLEMCNLETRSLNEEEVLVRMLASPINPADLNYIHGFYGHQPESNDLKHSSGMEGVGYIEASSDENLKIGNKVIVLQGIGTWSDYMILPSHFVLPIEENLSLYQLSMLKVNPMTAFRILNDFVKLKPGDWIIQNASNSGVGEMIIQLAAFFDIRTINLVRKKVEREAGLTEIGADIVLEEGDPNDLKIIKEISDLNKPKLAINAVGGSSAGTLISLLGKGGKLVTYGGLSMKNIQVNASQLIFKNISIHGFWLSEWIKSKPYLEVLEDYNILATIIKESKLIQSIDSVFDLEGYKNAVERAQTEYRNGKVIFDLIN
jgi:NADPH:quinone reductase-like Zn-dependent oxidoreductase